MRSRSGIALTVWTLAALMAAGCALSTAPRGFLKNSEEVRSDVYGGWMDLKCLSAGKTEMRVAGELIAVTGDTVFIADDALHSIALADVVSAQLMAYDCHPLSMGDLVVLGTLSTVSNGFLLVGTAPMWIIGGSIAAVMHSHKPVVNYPKLGWRDLARFARFPQGLPPGIDRSRIRMKSLRN